MNRAVVGVGSNIEPGRNVARARRSIARSRNVRLLAESKFCVTPPVGPPGQPEFLNGAFLLETRLDREDLRRWLRHLEARLGRVRTDNKYLPRPIDLDIVVWNGRVVDSDVHQRDFLREAVLELLPDLDLDG